MIESFTYAGIDRWIHKHRDLLVVYEFVEFVLCVFGPGSSLGDET